MKVHLRSPCNQSVMLLDFLGGDGIEMKKRYYSDAGDHATSRRSESK